MIDLSGINEKVNDTILNCKEDGYHRYKKEKDIIANQYKDKIIKSKDQLRESIDTFLSLNTNDLESTRDAKHLKIAINTDKTEIVSIKNLKDFDYFYNKSEKLLKEIDENINKFDNLTIEYLLNLILTLYNNKTISEEDLLDLVSSNNLNIPKMSGTRKMLPVEFNFDKTIKSETIHQAEKPIALIESLLDYITLKGELVLDQFGGSLNTAIACLNKGRNSILFEKDGETYNLSVSKKFN